MCFLLQPPCLTASHGFFSVPTWMLKMGLMGTVLLWLTLGCRPQTDAPPTLFDLLPAEETGVTFTNHVEPNDSLNIFEFNYFYNGGGVAIGDLNGDGLPDLYFSGNMTSNRLYLNRGGLHFEDVTDSAKVGSRNWSTGVSMADVNGDGRLDLYVCFSAYQQASTRANQLFINQGNNPQGIPVFREMAYQYGLDDTGYSSQAAFFDYDHDGDLDMYLATVDQNKLNPNLPRPKVTDGSSPSNDRLYRNEGNGHFTNVSKEAGILSEGFGLAVSISDLNDDGWPDIYVSNDFIYNDLLYLNNRNGTFTESAARCLKHQSQFAMGNDVADINNDGLPDIMVLDMLPKDNQRQKLMNTAMNYDRFQLALDQGYQPQYSRNTLQLHRGNWPDGMPMFSEIGYLAGIYQTDWSWSALLADFDNDGFRDLFVSNGIPKDITDNDFILYRDSEIQGPNPDMGSLKKSLIDKLEELPAVDKPDFMFRNNGNDSASRLTFTDQSAAWGITLPACSNGAAYADLDNDGDLDLVVNNLGKPASVFRNNASQQLRHHFLRVRLAGSLGNRNGLGARVRVRCGGKVQVAEQTSCRGFQSGVDPVLHLGLGKDTLVDTLEVRWPDGRYQSLTQIRSNQIVTLDYQQATAVPIVLPSPLRPLFTEEAASHGIRFLHRENPFIDFKSEPLLPHKNSQNGPGLAVGDVNGDGLDDFYLGGPSRTPGQLFVQDQQGKFRSREFLDPGYEDQGALFFDADGDGDQDLYVVSGGNEYNPYTATYQDRLYRNEGTGADGFPLLRYDAAALPVINASGSCVSAADYDADGDLDLFVGGRLVAGRYPLPAQSYLLRNDGGRFTDVTVDVCPALREAGLVTTALWTDFDGDGKTDLMLTGEWMPIRLFRNDGRRLTEETGASGLANAFGWWNSLSGGDFDNDGDMDYVAGNGGLNSRYKASEAEPIRLFTKDFDENGSLDPLFSYYIGGKPYLTHARDALTEQMVSWRKRFPRYADYANASLTDILSEKDQQDAYVLRATYLASCYLENLGKGHFRMQSLPVEAQFAPMFGTQVLDFDDDGNLDLLLTGNSYATEFVAGWYDASFGQVLKGDGKGHFRPLPTVQTGFLVEGDAKSLSTLATAHGSLLVAGINSGYIKAFAPRSSSARRVRLQPTDAWAEVTLRDGRKRREELYYGSGYLSQSSRTLVLPADVEAVTLGDYAGRKRTITPEPISIRMRRGNRP